MAKAYTEEQGKSEVFQNEEQEKLRFSGGAIKTDRNIFADSANSIPSKQTPDLRRNGSVLKDALTWISYENDSSLMVLQFIWNILLNPPEQSRYYTQPSAPVLPVHLTSLSTPGNINTLSSGDVRQILNTQTFQFLSNLVNGVRRLPFSLKVGGR